MPDLHVVFIGDGADRARIEQEAKARGLERVYFTGLLPREEVAAWLSSLDVLLVVLRDLAVFETVIPSKIFEYLALERPIVLAAPRASEIREMVEAADVGRAIDAERADLLAEAIVAIREDPAEAARMAKRGHDWVMTEFRRDDLARRMAARLEAVAETAS